MVNGMHGLRSAFGDARLNLQLRALQLIAES